MSYKVSRNLICIAALLSKKSAASLMSFALSTSALAEMTFDWAILLFLAASEISDYISGVRTISLMKISSMNMPIFNRLNIYPRSLSFHLSNVQCWIRFALGYLGVLIVCAHRRPT